MLQPLEDLNVIGQVMDFHEAFNHPYYATPCLPATKRAVLRSNLMLEETMELQKAMFDGDIVEIADAIGDCLYVLIGTAWEHGLALKLGQIVNEIHRSNMSKSLDMRSDGKTIKGANYTPPNLKPILDLE